MNRYLAFLAATIVAWAGFAGSAKAECINCNYTLVAYMLLSLGVAIVTAIIGLVYLVKRKRIPVAVIIIFFASALPVLVQTVVGGL